MHRSTCGQRQGGGGQQKQKHKADDLKEHSRGAAHIEELRRENGMKSWGSEQCHCTHNSGESRHKTPPARPGCGSCEERARFRHGLGQSWPFAEDNDVTVIRYRVFPQIRIKNCMRSNI